MRNRFLYAFLIGIIMVSCADKKVYDAYHHTPVNGWEKNDTVVFRIPPMTETSQYSMSLGLRATGQYPFTDLTLIIQQTVYPANQVIADTVDCHLIDDNGMPLGQGVTYYQYQFPVCDINLRKGDSLIVHVRHDMKREMLPGISDVGIRISKK